MKKEDVYKLIGYNGEYTIGVKKAIRKLLKENHPDNKGNREKFELINEVKKELELGKVSYNYRQNNKKINKNDDIDYDYCYQRIDEIKLKKNSLSKTLSQKRDLLNTYEQEYRKLYQNNLDLENDLLINSPFIRSVKNIKLLSIIALIVIIMVFTYAILKNSNIAFAIFVILSIICVLVIYKYLFIMQKITNINKKRIANYVKVNSKIRNNMHKNAKLKEEINEIERKINNLENDLRFYQNLLK